MTEFVKQFETYWKNNNNIEKTLLKHLRIIVKRWIPTIERQNEPKINSKIN
jgi:hypothetical protein